MKTVYLDTNIIIAPLRTVDPNAKAIRVLESQKHLRFVTGTLSILEIVSILSREEQILRRAIMDLSSRGFLTELVSLPLENQVQLIIGYLLNRIGIRVLDELASEPNRYAQVKFSTSPLVKLALRLNPSTKLRTLDNLHLSTAILYNNLLGDKIDYLVTSDSEFLSKRGNYKSLTDINVVSPELILQLEGAK